MIRAIDISEQPNFEHIDPGVAPDLVWVDLDRCRINEVYQRPIERRGWATIRKIAEGFSWARFGAIDVAKADDGTFHIIDGQHRAHAAAMCGIAQVPALVKSLTVQEQAAAFASINGTVTRLTPLQVFRAAMAAKEGWALQCDAYVGEAGCRLMKSNKSSSEKKAGEVFCVSTVRGLIDAGAAASLVAALGGLMQSDGHADPRWFGDQTVKALTWAVHKHGVTRPDLVARFLNAHDLDMIDRASRRVWEQRRGEFGAPSFAALFQQSIAAYLGAWLKAEEGGA